MPAAPPRRVAAARANEIRFDIGKPDMIRPAVGADLDVVAAFVVAAIDQHIANAGFAQFLLAVAPNFVLPAETNFRP
jgi:hypothetical protein